MELIIIEIPHQLSPKVWLARDEAYFIDIVNQTCGEGEANNFEEAQELCFEDLQLGRVIPVDEVIEALNKDKVFQFLGVEQQVCAIMKDQFDTLITRDGSEGDFTTLKIDEDDDAVYFQHPKSGYVQTMEDWKYDQLDTHFPLSELKTLFEVQETESGEYVPV